MAGELSPPGTPPLVDLAADPPKAATLAPEAIPRLLGELERLKALLWGRMLNRLPTNNGVPLAEEDRLLTVPQVAELLAIPKGYVYKLARRGEIPIVRLGKYVRVQPSDLDEWVGRHRQKGVDSQMYTVYSRAAHDGARVPKNPTETRADSGHPGRAARRHTNLGRPVGTRRGADPGDRRPAGAAPGADALDGTT